MYASPHRPAPPLRLRHSVGWFRFTFLALTLCAILSRADIYSTQRARSPALSVRRGAAPSTTIMSPSTCAPGCHPCSPVPTSPSLSISHTLPQRETRAHTWTVPGARLSARTGATQLTAPVVNHPPRRAAVVRSSRRAAVRVMHARVHSTPHWSTVPPLLRALCAPKGLHESFSPSFPTPLPRRPWIAQDI